MRSQVRPFERRQNTGYKAVLAAWMPLVLAAGCRIDYDLLNLAANTVASNDTDAGTDGFPSTSVTGTSASTDSSSTVNTSGGASTSPSDDGSGADAANTGGDANAAGSNVGGAASGAGGVQGDAGTSNTSGGTGSSAVGGGTANESGGSAAGNGTGGTSGATAVAMGTSPDLADGYWRLDATDEGGKNWFPSTLVFTSAASNVDGTVSISYRTDWYETTDFGTLLGGEEFGEGTFNPASNSLVFDQTSGWSMNVLDHYEATYDAGTDALVNGTWDTGTPGTFSGVRMLHGHLLPRPQAQASSSRNMQGIANAVDVDMMTYWSSANNATVGEVLTLTLQAPTRLRGMRILSVTSSTDAAPSRLSISSRDDTGTEVDVSDVSVPNDVMWRPFALDVDVDVSEIQVTITEITPATANRVVISSLELFGEP